MTQQTIRAISPGINYRAESVGYSGDPRMLDDAMFVAVAYSVRHLVGSYAGPLIKLTRASDSAVQVFYPGKDGWIDGAEITAWLAGSTATLMFFDQSGNGRDIEGGAPFLDLTGINGKPSARFTSAAATNLKSTFSLTGEAFSFLQTSVDTSRQSGGGPDYYFGLANSDAAGIAFGAVGDTENDYVAGDYVLFGNGKQSGQNPRFISSDGQSAVPTGVERWAGILSSSRSTLRRNGVALAPRNAVSASTIVAANQFVIGARTQTGSDGHPGWKMGELILFRSDINADLAAYEANMAEAWV